MAYDQGLTQRLHEYFQDRFDVETKEMFGGLCFMVSEHMCCAIIGEKLLARVGPLNYEKCLKDKYTTEMDFTGKPIKGMIYVMPGGFESDEQLSDWISLCESYISLLPPKKVNKKTTTKYK